MRKTLMIVSLILMIGITLHLFSQQGTQVSSDNKNFQFLDSYPFSSITYVGQSLPRLSPKRFPPSGLRANNTWFWHGSPVFCPDREEMFFVKMYDLPGNQRLEINYVEKIDGQWTEPQVPSFASMLGEDNNPFYSEDGNTLYFLSMRQGGGIFKVTRESESWSAPELLDIPIPSSRDYGWQFCIVRNGNIYLELWGNDGSPPDLYRSKLVNGRYKRPQRIPAVNTEHNEFSPYVDPEEKFMIFVSNRPGGLGWHDLYISFRYQDGTWSEPRNLGDRINSATEDASPYISPDGKYFFFTTIKSRDAGFNPYWVDARTLGIVKTKVFGHSDYDGDGRTDLAVFNPITRIWNVKDQFKRKYGQKNSIPAPGDYDGDGRTELAYYCPLKGLWKIRNLVTIKKFGGINDIPVPGDYDGDGMTDAALFNPFTSLWQICESSTSFSETRTMSFGEFGDIPVPGDYDGDGTVEIAVFRPLTGEWVFEGSETITYGKGTDLLIPADYNGDGKTDIATWDPLKGKWSVYGQFKRKFGKSGDIPVPGDYDGDGKADIAVYEPDTGLWKIRNQTETTHGESGDIPLVKGY